MGTCEDHRDRRVPRPFYRGGVSGRDEDERPRPAIPDRPRFTPDPDVARGPAPGIGDSAGHDVLDHGGGALPVLRWLPSVRWRSEIPRLAVLLLVAGLLAGAVAGYTAGERHGRASAVSRTAASASPAAARNGYTLGQSGNECSAQLGNALQLGIQVTNESSAPLTLREVVVVLPLGGLRLTAVSWGPCGQLPDTSTEDPPLNDATDSYLPPGGSGWLNVTVAVLVTCPSALPVQFMVTYGQHDRVMSVRLPGFPDLSRVPYRSCPVS